MLCVLAYIIRCACLCLRLIACFVVLIRRLHLLCSTSCMRAPTGTNRGSTVAAQTGQGSLFNRMYVHSQGALATDTHVHAVD